MEVLNSTDRLLPSPLIPPSPDLSPSAHCSLCLGGISTACPSVLVNHFFAFPFLLVSLSLALSLSLARSLFLYLTLSDSFNFPYRAPSALAPSHLSCARLYYQLSIRE